MLDAHAVTHVTCRFQGMLNFSRLLQHYISVQASFLFVFGGTLYRREGTRGPGRQTRGGEYG